MVGVVLCFVGGVAFHKYLGLSETLAFLKAPVATARVLHRDWTASECNTPWTRVIWIFHGLCRAVFFL